MTTRKKPDEPDDDGIMAIQWADEQESACGFGFSRATKVAELGSLRAEVSEYTRRPGCLWTIYHGEDVVTSADAVDITDAIRLASLYLLEHCAEWIEPDWADGAVPE